MFKDEQEFEQFANSLRFDDAPNQAHRDRLEQQLLLVLRKERNMRIRQFIGATPRRKMAAGVLAAVILIFAGWRAAEVYRAVSKKPAFTVGKEEKLNFKLPGGKSLTVGIHDSMTSVDPEFTQEKAAEKHENMKRLIAEGKYRLLKTDKLDSGRMIYVYEFTLDDGDKLAWGCSFPLEGVKSWEDYQQKLKEYIARQYGRQR